MTALSPTPASGVPVDREAVARAIYAVEPIKVVNRDEPLTFDEVVADGLWREPGMAFRRADAAIEQFAKNAKNSALLPTAEQAVTREDLAALGASDAACYLYPGEDQQAERAAFIEGAALIASALPTAEQIERDAIERTRERCAKVAEAFGLKWSEKAKRSKPNSQSEAVCESAASAGHELAAEIRSLTPEALSGGEG